MSSCYGSQELLLQEWSSTSGIHFPTVAPRAGRGRRGATWTLDLDMLIGFADRLTRRPALPTDDEAAVEIVFSTRLLPAE